ncbi:4a-hydroxytetrahydrobiopterin dehydratase [Uliginosibacterium paludis]|uniref:Putative pterin-4-alpha-carbinolamine dehydratase n=1 Tax=Uliginosibacterium paludis TaxID=1615952 RepID=A0ABV2CQF6_9RHOO
MRPGLLDDAALFKAFKTLNQHSASPWQLQDGRLLQHYRFRDFRQAFAFMTRVAHVAEAMDHHPDWSNVYNRVSVTLFTHDAGGITTLDFELAAAMESAARETPGR